MPGFSRAKTDVSLICLLGILVYSNTFHCSFHFDDLPSIVQNPSITNIHDSPSIWGYLPRRFLLYLSIALNYHFNGLDVFGYHLFNLAVHLISAVLVWWLTLLTFSTPVMKDEKKAPHAGLMALLAGLVFVAHPIQTQAVTYIIQRAASMATMFYLGSVCFYVRSRLSPHNRVMKRFYYIGALVMAVAAMFTKEIAITLPLMVLLYEYCFFKKKGKWDWKFLAPFLLTLLIIPLTMLFTETGSARVQQLRLEPGISPMHYFLTELRVMVTYTRLVFWPINQNLDYDYPIYKSIFSIPVLASLFFLVSILYGAKQLYSKYPLVSFAIFWFFLTLLPESSIMPIKDVIYEHRLYLPMAGFSIFLVSSAYYLIGRNSFKGMIVALTVLIVGYSVLTYQRNKVWKDEISLWSDVIAKSPHKARAYINRGAYGYFREGNLMAAIADYNEAIEMDPENKDAYYNRGLEYARLSKFDPAIADFNRVIEISPDDADAYDNRGLTYYKQGRFPQAVLDYDKAIEINPDYAAAYNNRGVVYYILKQYDKAWQDVQKAQDLGFAVKPGFLKALRQVPDMGIH